MNIVFYREVAALRRIAARYVERWRVKPGGKIRTQEGQLIAEFIEPELADYIARLHNIIIPLTNAILELRQKLRDFAAVKTR